MEDTTQVMNTGLRGVKVASTRISDVNGAEGKLIYRGYLVKDIAENVSFEEIVHLLLYETMPSKKEIKTLGANIHELLINGFFMNTSMGDFALKQIDDIIEFHNEVINTSANMIDSLKAKYEKIKDKLHFIQERIGEDYISGILKNHIEEIEIRLNVGDFKQRRIDQLEAELNTLRGS